jgi:glyoxylase-like metal-dependent hydrolase (beta-lactamase superfamily II)
LRTAAGHLKQKYRNIELAVHKADVATVESGDQELTCASFFYDEPFHLPCDTDITLRGGEELKVGELSIRIVHLPGHSPGHIGLLTEINGLSLMFVGSTLHGAYGPRVGGNLEDWKKSLYRLQDFKFDLFVESHSNCVIYADPKPRIDEALWKLETQYFQFLEAPFRRTRYEAPFRYP